MTMEMVSSSRHRCYLCWTSARSATQNVKFSEGRCYPWRGDHDVPMELKLRVTIYYINSQSLQLPDTLDQSLPWLLHS
jgi:hypothetical protein